MLGGVSKIFKNLVGDKSDRDIKEVMPLVDDAKEYDQEYAALSNDQLRELSAGFRTRINEYIGDSMAEVANLKAQSRSSEVETAAKESIYREIDKLEEKIDEQVEEVLEEILPQAFAVVKETARRFAKGEEIEVTASDMDRDLAATNDFVEIRGDKAYYQPEWLAAGGEVSWNMVHYDVQLVGGVALHKGKIAEMATGEGKTLVATLPVYLNALAGRGVHVITVNDYLARRDSEWMGPLFQFHGLSVDCIDKHEPHSEDRRQAYLADITYGTNNEFGFDYLRDNMARDPRELVQRKHNYAIIDEVDSVLIDDARTPLIIAGPTPKGDQHEFYELKPKIERLVSAQKKMLTTVLADAKKHLTGIEETEGDKKALKQREEDGGLSLYRVYRGLPKNKALIKFLSEPGMRTILQKTENYYLQEQEKNMHIVDDELYFTIDEKSNSIELTDKGIDLISGEGDKDFFILPDISTSLDAIDKKEIGDEQKITEKDQFLQAYTVKAERIHSINQLLKAYTLFEMDVDYVIMEGKVKIVDEQTGRIMEGRRYSDGLHQAIEAKENVKVESATQTYATVSLQNYFRMYHKLAGMTGTAETEAQELWDIYKLDVMVIPTNRPIVRNDYEDKVYKTEREKYNAVIDEIVELVNAERPVLVGTTSVEISELLSRMLKMKGIKHQVLNAKLHQREAEVVAEAGKAGTVTIATNMAGRGTDIKISDAVKEAGGLAIIGTERHESRRVDRQLRGRAGRQGDPGSSQFFVSLEDNLMRLFGSERIAKLMDRMGLEEGEVIQHSMITKSIERAQKKVEENNFGIRKRLLEYDDVMNSQREVIYTRRKHALMGDRLGVDISNMIFDVCESIANEAVALKDYEGLNLELIRTFSIEVPVSEEEFNAMNGAELGEQIFSAAMDFFERKIERIATIAYPVIENVFENQGSSFENIVIPFSDGMKTIDVQVNLKDAYDSKAHDVVKAFQKGVILSLIDQQWMEHLREMDDLKQSVQGARFEQKDPLLIYKLEAFNLFKDVVEKINREAVSFLVKASLPNAEETDQIQEARQPVKQQSANVTATRDELPSFTGGGAPAQMEEGGMPVQEKVKAQPVRVEKKVGRNEPCPCGSGKKYKHCHGK